jgi:predicted AlkP superfamily phosphohydrolase/phosphomutase
MEAYFGELDRAIADLVREAGPETTTILLSDHGMGPIHNREVLTLSLMERLGIGSQVNRSGIGRLRWLLEGKLGLTPGQLRKWTKRVLPEDWTAKLDARVRDAQLTAGAEGPAYVTALHANVGGIYINRDDYPDVQSLRDFREALVAKLQALVDPENGAPLVKTIHRREELYHGDAVDECPDVIFTLHESYGFADGLGTGGRLVQPRRRRLGQQGIHRPEGILIINGPGVRQASDSPQQLLDVTATLLYLLDIPIPEKMDSRPILAPFPDLAHTRPPVYEEKYVPQQATSGTSQPASAADQEAILARLRGLGYIE